MAADALRWTGLAGAVLSLVGLGLTYLVLPRTRRGAGAPADPPPGSAQRSVVGEG
ncbi:hypothetical protein [Nocardiopsis chromatogenes]|uniref:hypothetical protein n=1 Tax=Nocardiopsis chromatogenes TaxID=280239 RepID=UPI0003457E1D|nr:hypothetical protein [Nocardiopsis chromatogenes]